MISKPSKNKLRKKRHNRLRNKVHGTPERPRLNVYRSNVHIYAQIIDDIKGHTLVSASSKEDTIEQADKTNQAAQVGALVAKRANENGITNVVFDRGGYKYHGRVKALAEAARENGLEF